MSLLLLLTGSHGHPQRSGLTDLSVSPDLSLISRWKVHVELSLKSSCKVPPELPSHRQYIVISLLLDSLLPNRSLRIFFNYRKAAWEAFTEVFEACIIGFQPLGFPLYRQDRGCVPWRHSWRQSAHHIVWARLQL